MDCQPFVSFFQELYGEKQIAKKKEVYKRIEKEPDFEFGNSEFKQVEEKVVMSKQKVKEPLESLDDIFSALNPCNEKVSVPNQNSIQSGFQGSFGQQQNYGFQINSLGVEIPVNQPQSDFLIQSAIRTLTTL